MRKFSGLILTVIIVFSMVFCMPVAAAIEGTTQKKPAQVKNIVLENYVYASLPVGNGVRIQWDKVKGANYYRVYRKAEGQKKWTALDKVNYESYVDINVKNNKVYKYTVKAFNKAGAGAANTKGMTVKVVFVPTVKNVKNALDGVVITWNKVKYADKYYIYRSTHTEKRKKIKTINSGNTISYKDTDVKPGIDYYYDVVAINVSYKSGREHIATRIVWLKAPQLSSVVSTKNGIKFTWKKVKAADSYIVYRKEGNGKWVQLKKVEGNKTVSYIDSTAKRGKTYTYTVKASIYGYYTSAHNKTGLTVKDKY